MVGFHHLLNHVVDVAFGQSFELIVVVAFIAINETCVLFKRNDTVVFEYIDHVIKRAALTEIVVALVADIGTRLVFVPLCDAVQWGEEYPFAREAVDFAVQEACAAKRPASPGRSLVLNRRDLKDFYRRKFVAFFFFVLCKGTSREEYSGKRHTDQEFFGRLYHYFILV